MLIAFLQHKGILPNLQAKAEPKLVRYLKLRQDIVDRKKYEEMELVANIAFEESDPEFSNSAHEAVTTGELLIEFFYFYRYRFKAQDMVISITNKDNNFIRKPEY